MKIIYLLLAFYFTTITLAQIGIGTTTPDKSAILDIESSDKGLLIPRLTMAERDNIINPIEGLVIFCSDCCDEGVLTFYNGTTWVLLLPCDD